MKILVTGFQPFGGETVNPAYEAVKLLPDRMGNVDIVKLEIPVVFAQGAAIVIEAMEEHDVDAVLSIGQAGNRACITVEKVAINLMESDMADNGGNQPQDQCIQVDGDTAYFSTLPVKAMVENMREAGVPAHLSYTAGTYVCNELMYQVLHAIDKKSLAINAGFVHVPFATGQVIQKASGTPSMVLEMIVKGIACCIEAIGLEFTEMK